MKRVSLLMAAAVTAASLSTVAHGEILAMLNYESKPPEELRSLRSIVAPEVRREGLAIIDVDPGSPSFGRLLVDIPLPPDLVAHHLFYNRDMSKLYLTSLGQSALHVIDMAQNPYRLKRIDTPGCTVQENIIFSAGNGRWWVTCMGSQNLVLGNGETDEVIGNIELPLPYPHGIAINDDIDVLLVTSTVRASDLGDPGETVTALRASTGEAIGSYKVSSKPSPAGVAPVETLFIPAADPPVAYVTNMFGGTLWRAVWNAGTGGFGVAQAHDFASGEAGVPLEMYVNDAASRLYVTTAKPGHLHIFDIGADPASPILLKSLPAAEGAHHVAFTRNWKYAFVQNSLLNLPGMSDGSITIIDLETEEVVGSIDTLKEMGLNPNSIVLLPEWNHLAGH
jgi:DNA-binding beta-propeller fold protein YncE